MVGIPGWEVPDAIGLLIEAEGLRIYHTGDTEYDLRLRSLAYDKDRPIDVMMTVINGAGGNMNAHEAALLAWHIRPKILIPMHHILWKDFSGGEQATLDPNLLADTYGGWVEPGRCGCSRWARASNSPAPPPAQMETESQIGCVSGFWNLYQARMSPWHRARE